MYKTVCAMVKIEESTKGKACGGHYVTVKLNINLLYCETC